MILRYGVVEAENGEFLLLEDREIVFDPPDGMYVQHIHDFGGIASFKQFTCQISPEGFFVVYANRSDGGNLRSERSFGDQVELEATYDGKNYICAVKYFDETA